MELRVGKPGLWAKAYDPQNLSFDFYKIRETATFFFFFFTRQTVDCLAHCLLQHLPCALYCRDRKAERDSPDSPAARALGVTKICHLVHLHGTGIQSRGGKAGGPPGSRLAGAAPADRARRSGASSSGCGLRIRAWQPRRCDSGSRVPLPSLVHGSSLPGWPVPHCFSYELLTPGDASWGPILRPSQQVCEHLIPVATKSINAHKIIGLPA